MDRKTLIWVVLLTLSFFGINHYLQKDYEKELNSWKEQELKRNALRQNEEEEILAHRTAEIAQLPAGIFTLDAQHTQYHGAAIMQGGTALLILKDDGTVLDQIYSGSDSFNAVESFSLPGQQKLVLYKKAGVEKVEKLTVTSIPLKGQADLQFLPREASSGSPRWVELYEVVDGVVAPLSLSAEGLIPDGFFFVEEAGRYYPAALRLPNVAAGELINLLEIPGLASYCHPRTRESALPPQGQKEEFYALESPYMQVVFSSIGGSVVELNLPFAREGQSDDHFLAVREIEYDRQIAQEHTRMAQFPLMPALACDGTFIKPTIGGYYPLLRRGMVQSKRSGQNYLPPAYRAFALSSEYPELAQVHYRVVDFSSEHIVFESLQPQRRIRKTYRLMTGVKGAVPYCMDIEIRVEGDARGLWISSGVPEVEWITNSPAPVVKYRASIQDKSNVEKIDLPKQETVVTSQRVDWLCNSNGFFGIILDPLSLFPEGYRIQNVSGVLAPSRLTLLQDRESKFAPESLPGYQAMLPIKMQNGVAKLRIYAGPMADAPLSMADEQLSQVSGELNHAYTQSQEFHGWFSFVSRPIGKVFFYCMKVFYFMTHSWGIAIILLTVVLRVILFPLNRWSIQSNERMKAIGPKVAAIQARYKDNPKQGQMEVVQLYQKERVNPVGGCLPILLQLPFLFTMFDLLKTSFELRGAPFVPGWIEDLAAPDVVWDWGTPLYFVGSQLHLLPILVGVGMWLQQKFSSPLPEDRTLWTPQQKQQHTVMSMMTVVFSVMCYHFPSGLNIYWISSMWLGILQQWWFKRMIKGRST
jgi:YidC/Oxa1 family membrane protein insertase